MSAQTTRTLARMLSWLPLRMNQAVGAAIGFLAWGLHSKPRRITEINLKLCYPNLDAAQRRQLCRKSLIETGKQLTECAWIWHRPISQTEQMIIDTSGLELMLEAQRSGKGCLLVTPHLGNWELCLLSASKITPFTYFYRSPRNTALNSLLVQWRAHLRGQPVSLDVAGIKRGLKILKSGGSVGILPDQEPDLQNGIFAPFFTKPALTITLLSRLAQRSGATVLYCITERLPKGKGWRFHVLPTEAAIASRNTLDGTTALNRGIEACISLCPEQYLWSYKRFNTMQDSPFSPYNQDSSDNTL